MTVTLLHHFEILKANGAIEEKRNEVSENMNDEEKRWREYRREVELELEAWLARRQQEAEPQEETQAHLIACERQLVELDQVLEQAFHEEEEEKKKRRLRRWMAWAIWYDMEHHYHKTRHHRKDSQELIDVLNAADAPARIRDFAREFKEYIANLAQEDSSVPLMTAPQLCEALLCPELRTAEVFITLARQAELLLDQPTAALQCTDEQQRMLQGAVKIGKIFRKGRIGQDALQRGDCSDSTLEKAKEDVIFCKYVEQLLLGSNDVQKRAEILFEMNKSGGRSKMKDQICQSQPIEQKKMSIKPIEKNPLEM